MTIFRQKFNRAQEEDYDNAADTSILQYGSPKANNALAKDENYEWHQQFY